jgi:hypothetical protein
MRLPAVAAAVFLAPLPLACGSAHATNLAAHRAVYQLTLDTSRDTDVQAASGTMGYEVTDVCDGWAVRQRLELDLTNQDGQNIHMVSDYATWEATNGLAFRFHMKQTTDTAVTSQTDGDAKVDGAGAAGEVRYTTPKQETMTLPAGTLFPMAHTAAILAAAEAGKKFLSLPLFDGTDDHGAQDSFVTMLGWDKPMPVQWPGLSQLPSTYVHVSFFDRTASAQTPTYEVGMRYWANGVADDLQMNFGNFTVRGKLSDFKPQPHHC